MTHLRLRLIVVVAIVGAQLACAFHATSTLPGRPTPAQLAELWEKVDIRARDLLHGAGGKALAPPRNPTLSFEAADTKGASPGWDARDASGLEWDIKLGPEAQTEVAASRLLWAVGFHQPPTYFVPQWTLKGGPKPGPQPPGRFRPKLSHFDKKDEWSWNRNPFVGTRELRGLFVMMVLINNWDLKTPQNAVYQAKGPDGPRRLFAVQDLGASFGSTRWFFPGTKNDVRGFEREGFIKRVKDGRVEFHYRGAWREPHLNDDITPDDVRWVSGLLDRLSDNQWRDAFQAAGYNDADAARFIARLRDKVREGLSLPASSGSR